ncbi:MAG TPA: cytochrome b/b6 domain-containing protein [Gammaproteobacteria bacterium]
MQDNDQIKVWDPLVRLFHWSLVLCFFIAYVSGDEWESLHVVAGYAIAGLVAFRVVWGLIGTRHARFSDFVFTPATVLAYLKALAALRAKRYLGHNPAGGWMVVALLASLALTSLTGMAAYGTFSIASTLLPTAVADDGHDYDEDEDEGSELFEETHEFFAHLTLLLVTLHVAGVLISSLLHRENLVRAMITGRKPRDRGDDHAW